MSDFSSANASILIADDNEVNLDLLSEILTSAG
jgi:CheY-like chemotaxis protein